MDQQTPSLSNETNTLKEAYAALNRNDIPAFVEIFDPQIERIEHFPGGGTCHGLAAVTTHVSKGRGSWAEGSCEPQQFTVSGDRIIVSVFVHVRLKHETEWREGRTADVYTFRNGKAIQFHTFVDDRQALDWARVKTSDTN